MGLPYNQTGFPDSPNIYIGVISMGVIGIVLLVFFIIVAIFLVLLVLFQNEEGDSLGGIFAGGSSSAFGSRSGNVLTKTTTVLGALFLVISLGMGLMNRTPGVGGVEAAGMEIFHETMGDWLEEELNPAANVDLQQPPLEGNGTIE